ELGEDVDQVGLYRGSGHEQPGGDLRVAEVLPDQADDLQLAGRQARPARGGALALAAAPGGIGARLLRWQPGPLRPGRRKPLRAQGLPGLCEGRLQARTVDREPVAEVRPQRFGGRPEPRRFLVTVLLGSESGKLL